MKKFKRISVKPYDKYKFEVIEPLSVNLEALKRLNHFYKVLGQLK